MGPDPNDFKLIQSSSLGLDTGFGTSSSDDQEKKPSPLLRRLRRCLGQAKSSTARRFNQIQSALAIIYANLNGRLLLQELFESIGVGRIDGRSRRQNAVRPLLAKAEASADRTSIQFKQNFQRSLADILVAKNRPNDAAHKLKFEKSVYGQDFVSFA
jgi:hypothetical protein